MKKRKKYNLILRIRRDEKNISQIKYCGLKKVTYDHDKNKDTVKATLVYDDGEIKVVEHKNVIDVDKEEV